LAEEAAEAGALTSSFIVTPFMARIFTLSASLTFFKSTAWAKQEDAKNVRKNRRYFIAICLRIRGVSSRV
jgi:hypothetical protein